MRASPWSRTWPRVAAVVTMVAFGFPVYRMISTAFKPSLDIQSNPPHFLPIPFTLQHFRDAIGKPDFWLYVPNSFVVTLTAVVLPSSSRCLLPWRPRGCRSGAARAICS